MIIHGNKGVFLDSKVAGFNGSIAEDGTLSIVATVADGLGSNMITVHEEKIDVEEKFRSILEIHLRENIQHSLLQSKILNCFKAVYGVEYVNAKLVNPQTSPQDRMLLSLPEGNMLYAKSSQPHGTGDYSGPRWHVLKNWNELIADYKQKGTYYNAVLWLEKTDGTSENIERHKADKKRTYYDY